MFRAIFFIAWSKTPANMQNRWIMTHKIVTCILFLSLLLSCESKNTASVNSQSQDGNSKISVSGTKNFGDPWQTTIKIKAYNQEQQVVTEIYASDLNDKNVLFNWTDNNHCSITINQQDDTHRTFVVQTSEDKISLREE
jgi:hypothetical protein